jgi:protein-tyrosine kinase
MSRIHDALKKADRERAGAEPVDVAALLEVSQASVASEASIAPPPARPVRPRETEHVATATLDHLRFEDLQARCAHPEWRPNPMESVFNPALGMSGAEQFRTLRSRLYQFRSTQQLRVLLITSSVAGEGKTFVTSNLAEAIVRQPDQRVLIIDSDLRCSRLHAPLGAPSSPGLTDYLRGDLDEIGIIQMGRQNNLCFIPGGTKVTNPSELLSNGRLKTLLDRVTPIFDWVILDSPPCLPVADARVLADFCDGLLLVVKAGSTPCAVVQRARQELQDKTVVGAVLNSVQPQDLSSSSYYAHGYYGPDQAESEIK